MPMPHPDSGLLRAQLARIWGGTFALLVALALLFAAYGAFDYRTQLAGAEREAQELADVAALSAESTLQGANQLLTGMIAILQHAPSAATPHAASLRGTLLAWVDGMPNLMDLLVVEPPGRIVHWTGVGAPPEVADREYVRHHLRNPDSGLYVGEPQQSKSREGRWFFGVSKARRDEIGAVSQVVVATIDLSVFGDSLGVRFATSGSTLAIASADGLIYARIPDNVRHVGKRLPLPPEAAHFPAGTPSGLFATRSPLDERQRVVAFRQLRGTPLYAVGSTDLARVMAPWYERLGLVILLWLTIAAVVLVFARRLADAAREHETLAAVDGLTGVLNRRSLLGLAESGERRSERGDALTVLMIDVDHFKAINDRYGHARGDEALRRIAETLRACCRQSDLVGRYGGEEFLVVLFNASADDTRTLAEKMRQSVADIAAGCGPLSVSIGIAGVVAPEGTLDEAIRRADAAMYAAKAAGRNRVVVADDAARETPVV